MIEVVVVIFLLWVFRKVIAVLAVALIGLLLLLAISGAFTTESHTEVRYTPTVIPSQVIVQSELPLPILKPLPTIYMSDSGMLADDQLTPLGD